MAKATGQIEPSDLGMNIAGFTGNFSDCSYRYAVIPANPQPSSAHLTGDSMATQKISLDSWQDVDAGEIHTSLACGSTTTLYLVDDTTAGDWVGEEDSDVTTRGTLVGAQTAHHGLLSQRYFIARACHWMEGESPAGVVSGLAIRTRNDIGALDLFEDANPTTAENLYEDYAALNAYVAKRLICRNYYCLTNALCYHRANVMFGELS